MPLSSGSTISSDEDEGSIVSTTNSALAEGIYHDSDLDEHSSEALYEFEGLYDSSSPAARALDSISLSSDVSSETVTDVDFLGSDLFGEGSGEDLGSDSDFNDSDEDGVSDLDEASDDAAAAYPDLVEDLLHELQNPRFNFDDLEPPDDDDIDFYLRGFGFDEGTEDAIVQRILRAAGHNELAFDADNATGRSLRQPTPRWPPIILPPLQQQLGPLAPQNNSRMNRGMRTRRSQPVDQLVEVEMGRQRNGSGRQSNVPGNNLQAQTRSPGRQPDIIDLTGDDSPPQNSQNTRRQQSQHRDNAPRLTRSDSSYIGNQPVINLISDSDDDDDVTPAAPTQARPTPATAMRMSRIQHLHPNSRHLPPPQRSAAMERHTHAHTHTHTPEAQSGYGRTFADLMRQLPFGVSGLLGMNTRREPAAQQGDPDIVVLGIGNVHNGPHQPPAGINIPPINLNYMHHPFENRGASKPPHVPPPAPREGFTRDTGDEVAFVCPSCDDELAYDEDDKDAGRPIKKARTRKDMAEHHFWAVKACGHVYCRACYENRSSRGKSNDHPVHFRQHQNKPKTVLCAVDGCDSEVNNKTAWVGIFL